ncbi:MAG: hypothetical protein ABIN61_01650 [candidate division WOR-3 bacterium]
MKIKEIFKLLIAFILIFGCESGNVRYYDIPVPERYGASEYYKLTEQAKRRYLREYLGYDEETIEYIIKGKVFKGMSTEQALLSWGRPDNVDRKEGSWGVQEKWFYDVDFQGYSSKYLYFKNGRLEEWKE